MSVPLLPSEIFSQSLETLEHALIFGNQTYLTTKTENELR